MTGVNEPRTDLFTKKSRSLENYSSNESSTQATFESVSIQCQCGIHANIFNQRLLAPTNYEWTNDAAMWQPLGTTSQSNAVILGTYALRLHERVLCTIQMFEGSSAMHCPVCMFRKLRLIPRQYHHIMVKELLIYEHYAYASA